MVLPNQANGTIYNHEWKSGFAQEKSGRTTPTFFSKLRKKYLTAPPVRSVKSPRFTEEELDALTGDVPYETSYTYAFSKIYDPNLPDHWQVPNLRGASPMAYEKHEASTSLASKFLYYLRLPFVLVIHLFLFIISSIFNGTKLTVVTFWEYLVYCIRGISEYLSGSQTNSRSIRNRRSQSFLSWIVSWTFEQVTGVVWLITSPIRWVFADRAIDDGKSYALNVNGLANERKARVSTRQGRINHQRGFNTASVSPARSSLKFSSKHYSAETEDDDGDSGRSSPLSKQLGAFRTFADRSVTPVRGRVAAREDREDTPLSVYGLRSRNIDRNTPEPTFETTEGIRNGAASTRRNGASTFSHDTTVAKSSSSLFGRITGSSFTSVLFAILSIPYDVITWAIYKVAKVVWPQKRAVVLRRSTRNSARKVVSEGSIDDESVESIEEQHFIFSRILSNSYARLVGTLGYLKSVGVNTWYFLADGVSSLVRRCNCVYLLPFLLILLLLPLFFIPSSDDSNLDEAAKLAKIKARQAWEKTWQHDFYQATFGRVGRAFRGAKNFLVSLIFEPYAFLTGTPNNISKWGGKAIRFVRNGIYNTFGLIGSTVRYGSGKAGGIYNLFTHTIYDYVVAPVFGIGKHSSKVASFFTKTFNDYIVAPVFGIGKHSSNVASFFGNTFKSYIIGPAFGLVERTFGLSKRVFGLLSSKGHIAEFPGYFWRPFSYIWKIGSNFTRIFVINPVKQLVNPNFWAGFIPSMPDTPSPVVFEHGETEIHKAKVPTPPSPVVPKVIHDDEPPVITKSMPIEQPVASIKPRKHKDVDDKVGNPHPAHQEELIPITIPIQEAPEIPIIRPTVTQQAPIIKLDQEKIIEEITEKLRAELSVKFHKELSSQIEKDYKAVIEKLTIRNSDIKVDNTNLEALIRQMIYEYDADKTGQVDYALESSGASVISTRCSETYNSYSRLEKIWNIPLWYSSYGPRTVIQRNSKTLFPGECWSFKGGRGYLTIELSHHIDISSVSYEHIGQDLAPAGNRQSAPKTFKVWAYRQVDDLQSRVMIGDFYYDLAGSQLQFFITQNKPDFPVKIVELEITDNYGAPFTCLYRLRVHGKVHTF